MERIVRVHLDVDESGTPHWWAEDDTGYVAVAPRLDELKSLIYEAMAELEGLAREDVRLVLVRDDDAARCDTNPARGGVASSSADGWPTSVAV